MNGSGAEHSKNNILLAYLYMFVKFQKKGNSSIKVQSAIDYLPFYIMFFNISVLFWCNTKQQCCVALSICTKSWFEYGIWWFILYEVQSKMICISSPFCSIVRGGFSSISSGDGRLYFWSVFLILQMNKYKYKNVADLIRLKPLALFG